MVHSGSIRDGMQVIASDGGMVGRVTGLHGDHIHIEPTAPAPPGGEHFIPRSWVVRVDDHVHLDRDAALVRSRWGTGEPAGVAPRAAPAAAAASHGAAHSGLGKSWIVWLIGGLLLLGIIFLGIRGCGYAADDANYEDNAKGELTEADRAASGASAAAVGGAGAGALNNEVNSFFASSEGTPRTFRFETLRFDTNSAEIRSEQRDELAQLGRTLAGQPNARMRVVGYADARGSGEQNQQLGKQRAEAVAAALIANGVQSKNIETVSGGEAGPKATNRSAGGQAENRRTELVILSR